MRFLTVVLIPIAVGVVCVAALPVPTPAPVSAQGAQPRLVVFEAFLTPG